MLVWVCKWYRVLWVCIEYVFVVENDADWTHFLVGSIKVGDAVEVLETGEHYYIKQ